MKTLFIRSKLRVFFRFSIILPSPKKSEEASYKRPYINHVAIVILFIIIPPCSTEQLLFIEGMKTGRYGEKNTSSTCYLIALCPEAHSIRISFSTSIKWGFKILCLAYSWGLNENVYKSLKHFRNAVEIWMIIVSFLCSNPRHWNWLNSICQRPRVHSASEVMTKGPVCKWTLKRDTS